MEIFFVFLLAAAVRGLWKQTKQDLDRWNRRPPKPRGRHWWDKPITAGAAGYWGHQALHGFPTARHGLHDGWSRGREAHHRAQRGIAQARAEHAEGRAELHPELQGYRERRRKALQDLWEQQRWQPEEPAEAAAEPEPAAGRENTPTPGWASEETGERLLSPVDDEPRYEHAHCVGCGAWYAAGHRPGCRVAAAEAAERENNEPDEEVLTATSDLPEDERYQQEVEDLHEGFRYETCEECGRDWDAHDIRPDPLGHAHAYCREDDEQDQPEPDRAPGTDNTKGDETVSETSYQSVKARMTAAQAAAEQRQAEAKAAQEGTEERVEEAQSAQAYAETTGEEMQSLKVDSAVLGAMAEHQDALRKTVEAEQALEEAATAVNTAWQDVVETAGTVSQQLEASGHGNLDEAHANAAGGGAEREFYVNQ